MLANAIRCTAPLALVLGVLTLHGCGDGDAGDDVPPSSMAAVATADASGSGFDTLGPDDVERGRHDDGWRAFAEGDRSERGRAAGSGAGTGGANGQTGADPASGSASRAGDGDGTPRDSAGAESWDAIGDAPLEVDPASLPLSGEAEGPSVLAVQVLLDRARFSPGILDGYWGKNTEKAVWWLQSERGMEPTGRVDRQTLDLLRREAGGQTPLSREVTLTAGLVEGPFVSIPDDVYEQEAMDCLCYGSLEEKLAERFHTTPEVLAALNTGVEVAALGQGDALTVPDHGGPADSLGAREPGRSGTPDHILISDGGHYLQVIAADGSVLYHFPSTLGSDYAPSPSGDYAVNSVARDPEWHYQPDLLTGEDDSKEDAMVPAGPNNPVGVVWIDLTKPHYGIHGTSAPSTIGYATSHGCVRLTNWDAAFLADHLDGAEGMPVRFRDASRREGR